MNIKSSLLSQTRILKFHLKRIQFHYELYIKKTTYLRAKAIQRANRDVFGAALSMLNEEGLTQELEEQLFYLIVHYDYWFIQFELAEKEINQVDYEEFVFSREIDIPAFPTKLNGLLDQVIQNEYQKVKAARESLGNTQP